MHDAEHEQLIEGLVELSRKSLRRHLQSEPRTLDEIERVSVAATTTARSAVLGLRRWTRRWDWAKRRPRRRCVALLPNWRRISPFAKRLTCWRNSLVFGWGPPRSSDWRSR